MVAHTYNPSTLGGRGRFKSCVPASQVAGSTDIVPSHQLIFCTFSRDRVSPCWSCWSCTPDHPLWPSEVQGLQT
ncbi:hypothetical protein AAY473_028459 [Plecturocebus cupreus]